MDKPQYIRYYFSDGSYLRCRLPKGYDYDAKWLGSGG